MQTHSIHDSRPEAMADVPGVCELPLTRAVVQYRDGHEIDMPGGRIQDVGLAVVLEGRYAAQAEVIDVGSAEVKRLDLSGELVVLDWVYEPTLDHLNALVRETAQGGDRSALQRFCFQVGLRVLERSGYGPLTRSTLLRVGFRDICRDLDLHDGTSVRIELGARRIVRAHLDYDGNALVFRTPTSAVDPALEAALLEAFPAADLRRIVPVDPAATGGCQVRFPLPLDLAELRGQMGAIRRGLYALFERFEPGRHRSVREVVTTFGARATLARIRDRRAPAATRPIERAVAAAEPATEPERPAVAYEGTVH
ncbi:hypothetical protein V3331_16685 [Gaopeijia maritima]|uniref:hypothetical protein n=1 Tax=Gaopeijia maritima TaxID=3119007 RepID=UPI003253A4BD